MGCYIDDWNQVPDGGVVIEDTWPEVYVIITKNGNRYLRQVGWQLAPGRSKPLPKTEDRLIDFDPNCMYGQPWIYLEGKTFKDYRGTVEEL